MYSEICQSSRRRWFLPFTFLSAFKNYGFLYHYLFSVLQNFSLKVQAAIKELQQLQRTRKKDKVDRRVLIGTATIKEFQF
jgi:hypothetical protein